MIFPMAEVLPRRHHLLRVAPHDNAHYVAARAGVSIGVPLLTLWLTGHAGWAMYAAFGSFTSVYGRSLAHVPRMRMQLGAGITQTLAVSAGAVLATVPGNGWLIVAVVTVCAMLASLASSRLSWHPTGPMFSVFGVSAVASVPAPASQIPVAFAVTGASAAFAVIIAGAGRIRASARPSPAGADAVGRVSRGEALRYGAAVLAAGTAATAAGIGHPYWSMVAAVAAVTGPDTTARLTRAVHRIAGTLAGVLVAAALLAPHLPVPAIIVIVALLQGGTELLVGRNYGLALMLITPLALMMGELAHPVAEGALLYDRAAQTALGAAIGMVVIIAAHHLPKWARAST